MALLEKIEDKNATLIKKEGEKNWVLEVGIEPTLPKELDFESSASTSSATEAIVL